MRKGVKGTTIKKENKKDPLGEGEKTRVECRGLHSQTRERERERRRS